MKSKFFVFLSLFIFCTPSWAEGLCAKKEAELEKQISYAKEYGNSHRVKGLEKALAEVKAHCTEAGEKHDLELSRAKLERKIKEKEQDINRLHQRLVDDSTELKEEIAEAKAKGRDDKVAKYNRKLEEKKAKYEAKISDKKEKIARLQKELNSLNTSL